MPNGLQTNCKNILPQFVQNIISNNKIVQDDLLLDVKSIWIGTETYKAWCPYTSDDQRRVGVTLHAHRLLSGSSKHFSCLSFASLPSPRRQRSAGIFCRNMLWRLAGYDSKHDIAVKWLVVTIVWKPGLKPTC